MSSLTFYIVDVFAETKYAGNQLAVFTDAGSLATETMQQLAKEMNYSETTFILSPEQRSSGYDVRIFTPNQELPFAGHPTLGTAFILQHKIIQKPFETVALNLKVGQIPVNIFYANGLADVLWMEQRSPVFGETFTPDAIALILNLDVTDLDLNFPIQDVSTGVPFIIVPLKTHQALKQIRINKDRYFAFIEQTQAKEILVFCPETYHPENQLSVRVFADALGIPEDPATGSANGCLAGYLVQYRYFDTPSIDVRVEQGYEIGRPSLLLLRATQTTTKIQVSVGGRVQLIARGEFV
ncbi:MAG: PhzF family phenazine biosynthesis protein [Stenomitos rutilans HA7619-LM2]|jgi:trans-2,3-dihydro-3-hydroxyanthranilate isomerase|nr:PhzF family phenazine biosynthesis protein [Stenomitos rutilans HA7619-LM2]